ncbi:hypothetical protein ACPA9J_29570 [Pseudomonas aeruginosa]
MELRDDKGPAPWRHRPLGERRGREVGAGHRRGGVRQARVPHRRGSLRTDHLPRAGGGCAVVPERDKVEATRPAVKGRRLARCLERLNPTQYRVRIPVREEFSPNLTFSVLYTKGGDYSFQNAGIKVGMPQVEIDIATDKERYEPGETVTMDPGHALRRQTGFQSPDRQRGG